MINNGKYNVSISADSFASQSAVRSDNTGKSSFDSNQPVENGVDPRDSTSSLALVDLARARRVPWLTVALTTKCHWNKDVGHSCTASFNGFHCY